MGEDDDDGGGPIASGENPSQISNHGCVLLLDISRAVTWCWRSALSQVSHVVYCFAVCFAVQSHHHLKLESHRIMGL